MIEDDFYRSSSQYRFWSFTESSLQSLRASTNAAASDRVRIALRRARESRQSQSQSANSSAAGTPQPNDADRKPEEQEIECLTPEEEVQLVKYYCEQVLLVAEAYRPALPTFVRATAIQYLRRFYLTNSPMTYHPKTIMPCAVFLATKTDNYYMSLRHFADGVPGDTSAEDIIAPEFLLMQSLRFTFDVRHPFRGLEGALFELQAIAQGLAPPAPHGPSNLQSAKALQSALNALPSAQSSSGAALSTPDRLARAHTTAREILKTAAQMTDAYFLFTPAQIWLSAFSIADGALAQFYLDTKLPSPEGTTTTPAPGGGGVEAEAQALSLLRTKLTNTISSCVSLLQSYKPLASDPEQKKTARRIGKKLYQCQNPDKVGTAANVAGQKRIPAAAAAASAARDPTSTPGGVAAAGGGGGGAGGGEGAGTGEGTSESEMERAAKKRKLERERAEREGGDLFGGELVAQRTKEREMERQQGL